MRARRLTTAATLALVLSGLGAPTILGHRADVTYRHYPNCTALNKDYPHGVGKPGAVDRTSHNAPRVTNFYVSLGLYNANRHSDRDRDGIACEKH